MTSSQTAHKPPVWRHSYREQPITLLMTSRFISWSSILILPLRVARDRRARGVHNLARKDP